ncbi:MAG: aminofutalosine synthase MqnE, partial [Rikenellaceae bacterium]|nr:aminofutalosine synthase MqnE [Rikenellaceae bacterium]
FLDYFPHIQASWQMYRTETPQLALGVGANDIDGTIGDTTKIYSMAGAADTRPVMDVREMCRMIRSGGYEPVERDSFYRPVPRRDKLTV